MAEVVQPAVERYQAEAAQLRGEVEQLVQQARVLLHGEHRARLPPRPSNPRHAARDQELEEVLERTEWFKQENKKLREELQGLEQRFLHRPTDPSERDPMELVNRLTERRKELQRLRQLGQGLSKVAERQKRAELAQNALTPEMQARIKRVKDEVERQKQLNVKLQSDRLKAVDERKAAENLLRQEEKEYRSKAKQHRPVHKAIPEAQVPFALRKVRQDVDILTAALRQDERRFKAEEQDEEHQIAAAKRHIEHLNSILAERQQELSAFSARGGPNADALGRLDDEVRITPLASARAVPSRPPAMPQGASKNVNKSQLAPPGPSPAAEPWELEDDEFASQLDQLRQRSAAGAVAATSSADVTMERGVGQAAGMPSDGTPTRRSEARHASTSEDLLRMAGISKMASPSDRLQPDDGQEEAEKQSARSGTLEVPAEGQSTRGSTAEAIGLEVNGKDDESKDSEEVEEHLVRSGMAEAPELAVRGGEEERAQSQEVASEDHLVTPDRGLETDAKQEVLPAPSLAAAIDGQDGVIGHGRMPQNAEDVSTSQASDEVQEDVEQQEADKTNHVEQEAEQDGGTDEDTIDEDEVTEEVAAHAVEDASYRGNGEQEGLPTDVVAGMIATTPGTPSQDEEEVEEADEVIHTVEDKEEDESCDQSSRDQSADHVEQAQLAEAPTIIAGAAQEQAQDDVGHVQDEAIEEDFAVEEDVAVEEDAAVDELGEDTTKELADKALALAADLGGKDVAVDSKDETSEEALDDVDGEEGPNEEEQEEHPASDGENVEEEESEEEDEGVEAGERPDNHEADDDDEEEEEEEDEAKDSEGDSQGASEEEDEADESQDGSSVGTEAPQETKSIPSARSDAQMGGAVGGAAASPTYNDCALEEPEPEHEVPKSAARPVHNAEVAAGTPSAALDDPFIASKPAGIFGMDELHDKQDKGGAFPGGSPPSEPDAAAGTGVSFRS
mmetsp:Transcript_29374/g.67613  ORF Transcript_29374/g.67613 Transcript_29374/m.67613 type:complete len:960 (-) Transcript_29374:113-2992(-)